MMKIAKIIKKDLKLLLRSKTSSLIVIFGPLLIMLLVGGAFNNSNQYSISVSVYSDSYSELSESFLQALSGQRYSVVKADTNLSCVSHVKQGISHLCIIFPADLKIEDNTQHEVTFIADYSRINLVYMVIDSLSADLGSQSKAISLDLTQNLLSKIDSTKNTLASSSSTLSELSSKNSDISAKNSEQLSSLEQLSKAVDEFSANTVTISASNDNVKESFTSFKTDTLARISEIRESLSRISSLAASLGNSTDNTVESIQESINLSIGNTEGIEYKLNASLNVTDTAYAEVKLLTQNLRQNIDNTKAIIATLSSNSGSMKDSLAATTSHISSVQDAVNGILSDIGTIQVTSAEKITSPIVTKIQPLLSEKTHLTYILSGLIALVIMFISLLLSTTIVMMEKTSPSYFRNFISPTPDIVFVLATFFSTLILVLIQMMIVLGVSALFFENVPLSNLLNIYLAVVIITTVFTFIGMLIGHAFSSQETAILASISFGSVSLLLSNMILPLESMPLAVRNIAQYNPFVLSETMLKSVVLFNSNAIAAKLEIIILLSLSAVLFLFILFLHGLVKKHFIHRIVYRHKHSSPSKDIDKLLIKADSALKRDSKEEAMRHYSDAAKKYKVLLGKNDPSAKKVYESLKSLSAKLKIGYAFK